MKEIQRLCDPEIRPTDKVLADALGKVYTVYREFSQRLSGEESLWVPEWRYYNDGKAWLCKITHKKKTICWLSVWQGFFKVSLFFTAKTSEGVFNLPVDSAVKDEFRHNKPIGKLIPLVMRIRSKRQLKDVFILLRYKQEVL
jgi:hypothetical protein